MDTLERAWARARRSLSHLLGRPGGPPAIQRARLALLGIAVVALAAGAIVGAGALTGDDEPASKTVEEAGGGTAPGTEQSFLARLIPAPPEKVEGPKAPRSVEDLTKRLPLERKVAQLFLVGFDGTDLLAPIFGRLRENDLGGIVLDQQNYETPQQLASLTGEARVISQQEKHVPPFVLTAQEGGDFNEFADLPPAKAPSQIADAGEAREQARTAAKALAPLGVTGVLAPDIDVGGETIGERAFSDDPRAVAAFARATIDAYRQSRLLSAPKYFPGLGAASQSTEAGPAQVGLTPDELEERDLIPFRAAIKAKAPAIVVGHGLYATDDFVTPASLSKSITTDLLRDRLGFKGVAIADDLSSPAVTAVSRVPDAAVAAINAGADLIYISRPQGSQEAAYLAVLNAVRKGIISRERINEALRRSLTAKKNLGLIQSSR